MGITLGVLSEPLMNVWQSPSYEPQQIRKMQLLSLEFARGQYRLRP
jgi:hypothetical protein